ncbi:MAG TPA: HD domain-containing phosphohydrolase [Polyangiales bacterium]|nr:HD domain-containing phosphohydrolase [Polyangiales bacterium]
MALDDLLAQLAVDARWSAAELLHTPEGAVLQRSAARVLIVSGERVLAEPELVERAVRGDYGLLIVGAAPPRAKDVLRPGSTVAVLDDGADDDQAFLAIDGLLERVELKQSAATRVRELSRSRYELDEFVTIARAIARERNIDALLALILEKSRYLTGADAGSIYVIEPEADAKAGRRLRFKLSQNDSLRFEAREHTVPISAQSIAGAAALGRQPINVADVYALDAQKPYTFDPSFDKRVGYRTKSMLAMPMISAEDEVIGVIQLINRKLNAEARLREPEDFEREVGAFDERAEELLAALAAQAGIALENALLYGEIQRIFDGFVHASVRAIEQRDPTTSGHSVRVAALACSLAEQLDAARDGVHAGTKFTREQLRELHYASLLHDFGKIGVREQVLVKAKKLYPHELQSVRDRVSYALKCVEADVLSRKIALIQAGAGAADLVELDLDLQTRKAALQAALQTISQANEPTVLAEGDFTRIAEIFAMTFKDGRGEPFRLLQEPEARALQTLRGSLAASEYDEIRAHVTHTYNFLSQIPWGKTMSQIPAIAGAHHERVNGTGYPQGLKGDAIPLQAKIMSVADIYDALTAADRPYKRALPLERALDILQLEVKDGHLDAELVKVFREAEIYRFADRKLAY